MLVDVMTGGARLCVCRKTYLVADGESAPGGDVDRYDGSHELTAV